MSDNVNSLPGPNRFHNAQIVVTVLAFSENAFLRASLLESFPNSQYNDRGAHHDLNSLSECLADADGVIVSGDTIDDQLLEQCSNLKVVAKYGVGMDNIDMDSCERHGVHVVWTPGINKLAVAEQTIGFMLTLSRNLFESFLVLRTGRWERNGGFQLSGKTVGLIGIGNIGKEVVRLLRPFGCRILVNDVLDQDEYYRAQELIAVSKEDLFRESDIVSIHAPLNRDTRHMVDQESLDLMKESAILINTARGGIVNESDLKIALTQGKIRGAGLDVYEEEPTKDMELLQLPNVFCTPHIGGNSIEAVQTMGLSAIEGLNHFFNLRQTEIKGTG